ncbi:hypothetical protein ABW20_dc0103135 [Dactylellina cionopaga]|nr:hypothetical protein ABW20_dc0103135 [Dactylellina cionopaga]
MGQKRKRDANGLPSSPSTATTVTDLSKLSLKSASTSFQIIAGSYDRILHGIRVTIPTNELEPSATFTPLFLFTAHASSIRCLAVSPPSDSSNASNKRILATSSPDTKINLYHLHTRTNLGTLAPPSASPTTSLTFPSKSTLISTDEAGYIHIFRTRDWSLLTSIHCPAPKAKPGAILQPGGVNALAVHPSGKLALSVSKSERAVRMWNLMTGRKAGALVFPKSIPRTITGLSGEGIKVMWRPGGKEGYAVMFERGIVLFGLDSVVRGTIITSPVTKIHQLRFLEILIAGEEREVCLVATEDGRMAVYLIPNPKAEGTSKEDATSGEEDGKVGGKDSKDQEEKEEIRSLLIAAITPSSPDKSRIKDFDILPHPSADQAGKFFLTTANSEGILRVYALDFTTILITNEAQSKKQKVDKDNEMTNGSAEKDVGVQITADGFARMIGEYDTNRRITCLSTVEVEDSAVGVAEDDEEEEEDEDSENDSEEDDEDEEEEEWGGIGEDESK